MPNLSLFLQWHAACPSLSLYLSLSHTHTHTQIMRSVTFIFLSGWLDWVEFISMCPQLKVFRLTWSLLVSLNTFIFLFFLNYLFILFIWPCWILIAPPGIFTCIMRTLRCGMWHPVPWPGIDPTPPALETRTLSHWTARGIPPFNF